MAELNSLTPPFKIRILGKKAKLAARARHVSALKDDSAQAAATTKEKAHKQSLKVSSKGPKRAWGTQIFTLFMVAALVWGWWHRNQYIEAEQGVGYYLGIVGGVSMLALLLYPLRKRIPFLRLMGSTVFWFKTHMALGVLGPVLILYHANFGLGSMNANVALWSMLTVAGSGIIGRFFYTKIHRGLYGKQAEIRSLKEDADGFKDSLPHQIKTEAILSSMERIEESAFAKSRGMWGAAAKAIVMGWLAERLRGKLRRSLTYSLRLAKKQHDHKAVVKAKANLALARDYCDCLKQAAALEFYERLFAAWHVLHLPLFFMLILTAILHVIAVHQY